MRSFSSRCLSSCLDLLCGLVAPLEPPCWPLPGCPESSGETLRKVGVPSMVLTIGLRRPPLSNSCADIFRTGVVAPDPPVPPPLPVALLPLELLPVPPGTPLPLRPADVKAVAPLPPLLLAMSIMQPLDADVGVT